MSLFNKWVSMINGTAPDLNQTNTTDIDDKSINTQIIKTGNGSSINPSNLNGKDKGLEIATNSEDSNEVISTCDKKYLHSGTLFEQRFAWHKYLVELLSKLECKRPDTLRHFTIYIRKVTHCDFKWNDNTFKVELKQALESNKLNPQIGSSTLSIAIVSEREFKQIADKEINETQFLLRKEDIILFGSKNETLEQKFATAIDKREFIVQEFLKKFKSSTGTDSPYVKDLVVIAVRDDDNDDMTQYDWAGNRFEEELKRELANAFLSSIGSNSLCVELKPKSEIIDCLCLIENKVYYKWGKLKNSTDTSLSNEQYKRVTATISIFDGNGSLQEDSYILDSDSKTIYHIGRGKSSRKEGKYRINDIVINDNEVHQELRNLNLHVSSAHADIVFKNGNYYLRAAVGGCRALGGSPTKIVRNENVIEMRNTTLLYLLEDGDILELGKNVLLLFSLTDNVQTLIEQDN